MRMRCRTDGRPFPRLAASRVGWNAEVASVQRGTRWTSNRVPPHLAVVGEVDPVGGNYLGRREASVVMTSVSSGWPIHVVVAEKHLPDGNHESDDNKGA
jgi:hypothetical protein